MGHDTHQQDTTTKTPKVSSTSAIWLVIIVILLFVSAVNFVNVMGHDEEGGHGEAHTTEQNAHDATNHNSTHIGDHDHEDLTEEDMHH